MLVDTLTDPVLTSGMLSGIKGDVKALVYTHPDVDHILGDQAVPSDVPRLGTAETQREINSQLQSGMLGKMSYALALGHFIWGAVELVGLRELFDYVPTGLQGFLLKVLGWARSQTFLAHFSFEEVDTKRSVEFSKILKTGSAILDETAEFRHFGAIHSKSDSVIFVRESKVAFTGDLLFIGIAPVMWGGPATAWIKALTELVAETGDEWLFVPGHGPVTDANGVRLVRSYFEYLDQAVTDACADLPLEDAALDEACADRVLAGFPAELAAAFQEPQRILICAAIERMSRRAGGLPAKVQLGTKVKYMAKMGEYDVRKALGLTTAVETAVQSTLDEEL